VIPSNINERNFWPEFAKLLNADIKPGEFDGSEIIEYNYKNWKISFDHFTLWSSKYSSRFTRIIVPVSGRDNFRFEIYQSGILSSVAKIFGMQDIKVGLEEFDKKFIVKSNDEFKIKSMFMNSRIPQMLENLPELNLQTSDRKGIWEDKLPEKDYDLAIYFEGRIFDVNILLATRDLIIEIIEFLSKSNSIKQRLEHQ
jgi:hypothetical protein